MVEEFREMIFAARYGQRGFVRPSHFHYVAPSFWAWRGGETRLKRLSEFVDHVLCILPFEEKVCRLNGLDATFVGHPTLEYIWELNLENDTEKNGWKVHGDCEKFHMQYGLHSGAPIISLLPGSRLQEVRRMLSIFSNTMKLLRDSYPELTAVVHVAPNQDVEDFINKTVQDWPVSVVLIPGGSLQVKYDAFSASRVALCTSGTVAMELQLAQLPCVVAYRAHFLTEWFIRQKATIPYISLPNILLNSPLIPEALFEACKPPKLAALLVELMQNESRREEQIVAAEKVIELLRPSARTIGGKSMEMELGPIYHDCTPSMIAASTVLYSIRSS